MRTAAPRERFAPLLHRNRIGQLVVAASLLASIGCGARWTDDQRAEVTARNRPQGQVAAGQAGTEPGAAGSSASSTSAPTATAGSAGGGGPTSSAATAPDGEAQAPTSRPCTAPSNAPGVTDAEISVGTISTVSGPVPGLGVSAQAAARSYVAYLNAGGGVCGRKVVLRSADDGADNGRYRAIASEFSSTVLGVFGGLAAGDAGGADVVESNGIPVVSLATSDAFQNAATVFDVNPPPNDVNAVIGKYRWLVEQGVHTVALVYTGVDQARSQIAQQRAQMEAAGIRVVLDLAAPLSTLSWDSAARAVANSGADYLFFLSSSDADASMARSMRDTGYQLKFEEYLTAYGSNFIDFAGDAAEGTSSWIRTLPSEDGGAVPEQARFLEWMAQTAPDALTDTFASDSWVAAKAFFDALQALPGPISRDALLTQLRATGTYDAGGFLGPIQLGAKRNGGCLVATIVQGGAWRRLTPGSGFLC